MIYIFLANGFEECEALAPIDILRRGKVGIKTVGVGSKTVCGSHSVPIVCDITDTEIDYDGIDGVILPGGMPGTINLEKSEAVQKAIDTAFKAGKLVAAICAAPSILGHKGILDGKNATCYPGFEKELKGAVTVAEGVVCDGNVITANGPGAAYGFGLKLLEYLTDDKTAQDIKKGMQIK